MDAAKIYIDANFVYFGNVHLSDTCIFICYWKNYNVCFFFFFVLKTKRKDPEIHSDSSDSSDDEKVAKV